MAKSEDSQKAMNVNINLDTTPIFYTDNIHLTGNSDGVVLDIMQRVGSTNQVRVVARVGMSRDHAKKFTSELGKLLLATEGSAQTSIGKAN